MTAGIRNVLTIDLEDWFHVTNFEPYINREDWHSCPPRVQHTVPRLLEILAQYHSHATFFCLGWIAREFPHLIRRIADAGHELATHGQEHRLLTRQTSAEFKEQLILSRDAIEQAGGVPIFGHRAPTYSLRQSTEWAVRILLEAGFQYDSSVYPFGPHWDPGLCDSRFPCHLYDHGTGEIAEYPLTTYRLAGRNLPVAGGGYFRLLPYPVIRWAIRQLNQEGKPAIMYLHPWELDPYQPRVSHASWLARFRHYHQLEHTETKLKRLLSDFRFGSIREVFWSARTQRYELDPQP